MTDALAALVVLTAMEIVLGIDNLVFIAIVTSKRLRAVGEPVRLREPQLPEAISRH